MTSVEVTHPPTDICQGDCGLLISGGWGGRTSTEIYNPATNTTCPGPDLPDGRFEHIAGVTDAGVILCSGLLTPTSCLRLAAGNSEWEQFATISARFAHTSWVTSTGKLMLLGGTTDGDNSLTTTEVVGEGPSFSLQRAASYQCLISLGDKAVLVGGEDDSSNPLAEVTVYTEAGFMMELPRLESARISPACGVVGGMLVVAGGYDGSGRLDTVELLPSLTAPAWQQAVARLPNTVFAARMTAVNGRLLLTGGNDGDNFLTDIRTEILEFDPDTTEWRQVGSMENERSWHASVAVTQPDSYCA